MPLRSLGQRLCLVGGNNEARTSPNWSKGIKNSSSSSGNESRICKRIFMLWVIWVFIGSVECQIVPKLLLMSLLMLKDKGLWLCSLNWLGGGFGMGQEIAVMRTTHMTLDVACTSLNEMDAALRLAFASSKNSACASWWDLHWLSLERVIWSARTLEWKRAQHSNNSSEYSCDKEALTCEHWLWHTCALTCRICSDTLTKNDLEQLYWGHVQLRL